MLILSVILAVIFYSFVILAVGMVLDSGAIAAAQKGTGLVTADAMAVAFRTFCYGKGNYCWRNVWNYYIMEFVYDRRITCNVFHGRVLYDTKNVFKTASKT